MSNCYFRSRSPSWHQNSCSLTPTPGDFQQWSWTPNVESCQVSRLFVANSLNSKYIRWNSSPRAISDLLLWLFGVGAVKGPQFYKNSSFPHSDFNQLLRKNPIIWHFVRKKFSPVTRTVGPFLLVYITRAEIEEYWREEPTTLEQSGAGLQTKVIRRAIIKVRVE